LTFAFVELKNWHRGYRVDIDEQFVNRAILQKRLCRACLMRYRENLVLYGICVYNITLIVEFVERVG